MNIFCAYSLKDFSDNSNYQILRFYCPNSCITNYNLFIAEVKLLIPDDFTVMEIHSIMINSLIGSVYTQDHAEHINPNKGKATTIFMMTVKCFSSSSTSSNCLQQSTFLPSKTPILKC